MAAPPAGTIMPPRLLRLLSPTMALQSRLELLTRRMLSLLLIAVLTSTVACGEGPTTPQPTQENIGGNYSASVTGVSQGVVLVGTYRWTITQNGTIVGGNWTTQGILTDGMQSLTFGAAGTLSGTIAVGDSPSVSMELKLPECPDMSESWVGTYASASRQLVLKGSFLIVTIGTNSCTVELSYPMTLVLNRE